MDVIDLDQVLDDLEASESCGNVSTETGVLSSVSCRGDKTTEILTEASGTSRCSGKISLQPNVENDFAPRATTSDTQHGLVYSCQDAKKMCTNESISVQEKQPISMQEKQPITVQIQSHWPMNGHADLVQPKPATNGASIDCLKASDCSVSGSRLEPANSVSESRLESATSGSESRLEPVTSGSDSRLEPANSVSESRLEPANLVCESRLEPATLVCESRLEPANETALLAAKSECVTKANIFGENSLLIDAEEPSNDVSTSEEDSFRSASEPIESNETILDGDKEPFETAETPAAGDSNSASNIPFQFTPVTGTDLSDVSDSELEAFLFDIANDESLLPKQSDAENGDRSVPLRLSINHESDQDQISVPPANPNPHSLFVTTNSPEWDDPPFLPISPYTETTTDTYQSVDVEETTVVESQTSREVLVIPVGEDDQSDNCDQTAEEIAVTSEDESSSRISEKLSRFVTNLSSTMIGLNPYVASSQSTNQETDSAEDAGVTVNLVASESPPPQAVLADEEEFAIHSNGLEASDQMVREDEEEEEDGYVDSGSGSYSTTLDQPVTTGQLVSSTHRLDEHPDMRLTESELQLGKVAPFWIPDNDSAVCMICEAKFTVVRRRHHCRACGRVLCNLCCSQKAKLSYMSLKETRVCAPCFSTLQRIDACEERRLESMVNGDSISGAPSTSTSPEPGSGEPAPTLTPDRPCTLGKLKHDNSGPREPKHVMFSDGIKPGGDLRERPSSALSSPSTNHHPGGSPLSPRSAKLRSRAKQGKTGLQEWELACLLPEPSETEANIAVEDIGGDYAPMCRDEDELIRRLTDPKEKPLRIAVKSNLRVLVKICKLDCCAGVEVWCFCSEGLSLVNQDEVVILLERLPSESELPMDILRHYNSLYDEAYKGNFVSNLGHTIFATLHATTTTHGFLGSRDNVGFVYFRPTMQCLENLILPASPFLCAVLIHRWEAPWAKVFPLRLLLRLGAEFKCYPCPLFNVRDRRSVFFEIGHTILNLLADFRNYAYTLPEVPGSRVFLEQESTNIVFPVDQYNQVMKILSRSNEHVLAFGASFCGTADSHLICVQMEDGQYQSQAISIQDRQRTVTAASFVVFNASLKTDSADCRSSIVEDGIMIQLKQECMDTLREKLRNQEPYTISGEGACAIIIKWDDTTSASLLNGPLSEIDGRQLDSSRRIRFSARSTNAHTDKLLVRLSEVYIIRSDEDQSYVDSGDLSKPSRLIATAASVALLPFAARLREQGHRRIALRVTLHPETVEYSAGAGGGVLDSDCMCSLDVELIPVLHSHASHQPHMLIFELILVILDI